MRTFNDVLREAGFEPQGVRLVRHQDFRLERMSVYDLWRTERLIFEYYQSVQRLRRSFPVGSQVASFVVDPDGKTLFVGLYDVVDRREASDSDIDPVLKIPSSAIDHIHRLEKRTERAYYEGVLTLLKDFLSAGDTIHVLEKRDELADYEGVMAVDWGPGTRAFLQRAHLREKPILKLRKTAD